MKRRLIIPIALAIACALTTASAGYAQPQNPALSKTRLMKLLLLGDSSPPELIQAVNQKGVDFKPTQQDENELRQAGASDDLIAAVRANYRGNGARDNTGPAAPMDNQNSAYGPQPAAMTQPQQANLQPQPATNQRPQKRSFLDKLNDALQVASNVNSMVQGARRRGVEPLSEPDASVALTTGSLANTAWGLTSMTAAGATEKPLETPSDVRFCDDGGWVIHHADGTKQSGTYQLKSDRLIMKTDDGSLFSDCKINQSGDEMTLDDGKYVLRLKYRGAVKC